MRQFLFIALACIVPQLAIAQTFDRTRYSLETFHFQNQDIIKQRYAQSYLATLMKSFTQNTDTRIAYEINQLQASLDQIYGYIIENKDAFYNVDNTEWTMRGIQDMDAAFDLGRYKKEMYAYKKITDERFDAKEELKNKALKAREERLQRAKEAKQRMEDSVAAVAQYEQHLKDSAENVILIKDLKRHQKEILRKYGSINGKAINSGRVLIGMNKDMCMEAWGKPLAATRSTTSKGVTEKWVYDKLQFITFTNGRVTAIHEGGIVE